MNRLSILTAAAATLGLALAAPAGAGAATETGWLVYVKGSQTTTWDIPMHEFPSDCFHTEWGERHGRETITFKARKPTKAVLTAYSPVVSGFSAFGTLKLGTPSTGGIDIDVALDRDNDVNSGTDPGTCGGESYVYPAPVQDCGTRRDRWIGSPRFSGGKAELTIGPHPTIVDGPKYQGYASCSAEEPDGATAGTLTDITTAFDAKRLLKLERGERIIVNAKRSFTTTRDLDKGAVLTARTDVRWQLRMLRVR